MYSSVGDGDDHESPILYYIVLCVFTDMCIPITYATSHIISYIIFYVAFWGCSCDWTENINISVRCIACKTISLLF